MSDVWDAGANSKYTADAMRWLAQNNVKFEPIYSSQSFEMDGMYIFWAG